MRPQFPTVLEWFFDVLELEPKLHVLERVFPLLEHVFALLEPPQGTLGSKTTKSKKKLKQVHVPIQNATHPTTSNRPTNRPTLNFEMAAMTVTSVLENSAFAKILRKHDEVQAEFERVEKQINELTQVKAKMTTMKKALDDMVASSPESVNSIPDWLDPFKFPSELSVDPSKITKVHDWADVILNAFGVGPGHDTSSDPENIQDMLYAIQSWTGKRNWTNGVRGTVESVKMTRIALSPNAAYYEGEWGSGVDIYKTTDGVTFQLWMHEYEQYPSCYPQLMKGKFCEGPEQGTEYVYLAWEYMMCSRVTLMDGTDCWMADESKEIPDEVREMKEACE